MAASGLRLHGFGLKLGGLRRAGRYLASSDSLAWSATARRRRFLLDGCAGRHRTCANCLRWALRWWRRAVAAGRSAKGLLTQRNLW